MGKVILVTHTSANMTRYRMAIREIRVARILATADVQYPTRARLLITLSLNFISESVEIVLILILNLYQSVIPTSMVADIFKQLLIEKWKQKEGLKVRHGCSVPGPAAPYKQDIVPWKSFQYKSVKICQRAKSVQNLDAEFEVSHTCAKILHRPLE